MPLTRASARRSPGAAARPGGLPAAPARAGARGQRRPRPGPDAAERLPGRRRRARLRGRGAQPRHARRRARGGGLRGRRGGARRPARHPRAPRRCGTSCWRCASRSASCSSTTCTSCREDGVVPPWVPDRPGSDDPDAWHPLDELFAPLRTARSGLLGVISVDLPRDGRRPGPEQLELLEMYAAQASVAIENAQLHAALLRPARGGRRGARPAVAAGREHARRHRRARPRRAGPAVEPGGRADLRLARRGGGRPAQPGRRPGRVPGEPRGARWRRRSSAPRSGAPAATAARSTSRRARRCCATSDGPPFGYLGVYADMTERVLLEEELRTAAHTDALTGLANRALFGERLQRAASVRHAAPRCCCSTSTASRPSTTARATPPATGCSSRSPAAPSPPAAPATWWPGSAATSSWCCSAAAARPAARRRAAPRCSPSGWSRRSPSRSRSATARVSLGASVGARPPGGRRAAPTTCCATPTSRCTPPRRPARASTGCSSRSCAPRLLERTDLVADLRAALQRGRPALRALAPGGPGRRPPAARLRGPGPLAAPGARRAAAGPRSCSWPSSRASSSSSAGRCCTRPARRCAAGSDDLPGHRAHADQRQPLAGAGAQRHRRDRARGARRHRRAPGPPACSS